ncbi:MAG: trypsin-like peptidase domain-containing protein [Nitrospiraceae bacterium]|nr:trypsin-like peptidase domain-containing protein [Nitrospiraceae bacterium]
MVKPTVGIIIQKFVRPKKRVEWRAVGTAFQIAHDPLPTFMTCAHVMLDGHQRPRGEFAVFAGFGRGDTRLAGVRIEHVRSEIDALIFVSGHQAKSESIVFADDYTVGMGEPVAAIGAPLQSEPEWLADGTGKQDIAIRLAVGWACSHDIKRRFKETLYTDPDLNHIEINMLGYPGISGGPLFNAHGHAIGMMRGSAMSKGEIIAPYCYANRASELLAFARDANVKCAISKQSDA